VTSIEFAGFSPEAERELRSRLPIREGDAVSSEDLAKVSALVSEFDSHAGIAFSQKFSLNGGPDWTLRISVAPAVQPAASFDGSPAPRMIGGAVMQANRINLVTPIYPALAKSARIQGDVKFNVIVATDGTVRSAEFVSGHPLLVPAAKDAVMQWVYKPTTLNGQPVEVQTDVTVHFTLAE
jgi:TonB family protein